ACERYRESWQDAPPGSWGRPIAILKARVLSGDWDGADRDAAWTLEQGAGEAASPIGRYAAALAYAVLRRWDDLRIAADALRLDGGFPADVADALAFPASPDPIAYVEAVAAVPTGPYANRVRCIPFDEGHGPLAADERQVRHREPEVWRMSDFQRALVRAGDELAHRAESAVAREHGIPAFAAVAERRGDE